MFHEHVIADRINKGAEALGLAQATVSTQDCEDTRECFLTHVLNCLEGLESRPKLYPKQAGKVCDKMLLGLAVTRAKSRNVICIERMKLQTQLRKPER
jgi:hypothetical protein